jgi:transposase-like protein
MHTEQTKPQTLQEAILFFSDKKRVFELMTSLRWPDGVTCPYCGGKEHSFISTRYKWKCKNKECKKQFSLKAGTIMEDSPIGLDKWMSAIWLIANAKNGISSYEIHRALGVTQKTAWFLLHRIRLAMQEGTIEKLSGTVEADETYIGGKARNMHKGKKKAKGRGAVGKAIVMGLLERGGKVRTKVLKDTKKKTLHKEVKDVVQKGSNLFTDAFKSYTGLDEEYIHKFVDHAVCYVEGHVHTNGLENFWSLVKRTIGGTYVSVEPFHLFRYLDEQAFRFNERKGNDADRFLRVASSVAGKRLTYSKLTANEERNTYAEEQAG